MISICIPVYNFNVSALVRELGAQLSSLDVPAEIVIIDDASAEDCRKEISEACHAHKFIMLDENVGRARIRNLFLRHTSYEYLLFLDGDSLVTSPDFLRTFAELAREGKYQVVCGGRIYPEARPPRKQMLRWKYGKLRESRSAGERMLDPNRSFMTNNFMVHRRVLKAHPFDERLVEYGHEDTLFGFALKKGGINVHHVENPVLNGDLENNREFLEKTEKGIHNLVQILNTMENPEAFSADVSLLRAYAALNSSPLSALAFFIFRLTQPMAESLLARGIVNMRLFDSYKLGILVRMAHSE